MRNRKTYLSMALVLSMLWLGALMGLLIEINRFFSRCVDIPRKEKN